MERIEARRETIERVCEAAASVVFAGGTLIFPTDTVYGIGCDPSRPEVVAQIFRLKGRPATKPLALHLATVGELLEYTGRNVLAAAFARRFMPGPVTIVVERPPFVDARISAGLSTIGLRVPAHPLCSAILARCGPLAATSANFSGERAFSGGDYAGALPAADLLVDDGPTPLQAESTVVDFTRGEPRIVRQGVITVEQLEQHLAGLGPAARPNAEEGA